MLALVRSWRRWVAVVAPLLLLALAVLWWLELRRGEPTPVTSFAVDGSRVDVTYTGSDCQDGSRLEVTIGSAATPRAPHPEGGARSAA